MKRSLQNKFLPAAFSALALVIAGGCDRDGVKVYHVETNDVAPAFSPPPPATTTAAMPAGLPAPDNSGLPQLKYTVPAGWTAKAPSQMRVASFEISKNGKSVDVSVVPLGGMGGGDFANVNRWRGQLQLQPVDDGAIQQLAETVDVAGQPAALYDLTGTTADNGAQRIIAVIAHRPSAVWFFKMTGDADLTEQEKPAFVAFLKSLQFTGEAVASPADMDQLPPSHPPIGDLNGGTAVLADDSGGEKPVWTVPDGWQSGPSSQFLIAKYIITGVGGAQADVNISSSPDGGGGLTANVNRWRGQLGLSPVTDVSATPLSVPGGLADLVDFSGTDARAGQPARLVGVMVSQGTQAWFYKLMGDPKIVAQQKDAFTRFIQSAKYPDVH